MGNKEGLNNNVRTVEEYLVLSCTTANIYHSVLLFLIISVTYSLLKENKVIFQIKVSVILLNYIRLVVNEHCRCKRVEVRLLYDDDGQFAARQEKFALRLMAEERARRRRRHNFSGEAENPRAPRVCPASDGQMREIPAQQLPQTSKRRESESCAGHCRFRRPE